MPQTSALHLRYPLSLDQPKGAAQLRNLAEDAEREILAVTGAQSITTVVDSPGDGSDATDATLAALSLLDPAQGGSGGTVAFRPGRHVLDGIFDVPQDTNLVGPGKYAATLSLAAGAQIRYSDADTNQNGGRSGGFTLTGNGQVANPLYIGRVSNRMFSDMRVHNCTGDAILMEGTQNTTFVDVEGAIADGSCLTLGTQTNNLAFVHCSFFDAGLSAIRFEDTLGTQNPRRSQFFGGLAENIRSTGEACILIRAGLDISFWGTQTSTENNGAVEPACVKIDQAVGSTVRYIRLNGMQLLSQAPDGVCVDVAKILASGGDMDVSNCYFRNGSIGMRLSDDVRMVVANPWGLSDLATPVVKTETGVAVVNTPTLEAYV